MAKAPINYEDDFTVEDETVLSRLEEKNRAGTSLEDAYDTLSFLPGTGEAIAAYELPGILSQSGKMMQSKDFLEAAAGTGLATLGVASVLPGIGPVARYAKKGIEGFIPYLGPKTATAGGPDIDTSITKMEGPPSGGGSKAPEKTKLKKDPSGDGSYLLNLNNKEYKISKFLDDDDIHRGEWSIFERAPATEYTEEGWDWMDTVTSRGYAVDRVKEIDAAKQVDAPATKESSQVEMDFTSRSSKTTEDLNLGSGSLFAPEEKAGRRLLVLSCSDTKCPDVGDKEAIDRYLGPVFQSLKSMGTPADVDVAIMSAKHGLIRADTPIQNYNDKMSPKKADMFKQDAGQMDRIKNTLDGYDNVIVQGGKDYKDVIRAAAGDAKITEVPGGRGIGDQRKSMKEAIAFGKIDTPVYHYSKNTDPGFTKFSESNRSWIDLGPHVGSTPQSSQDRFIDEVFGVGTRKQIRDTMAETGQSREEVLKTLKLPPVIGNVGYDTVTNRPIPRNTLGGSIRLKADLSKPFDNPRTGKPFTEASLNDYQAEQYSIHKGERYTADDILSEDPRVDIQDVKKFLRAHSKSLAAEGYTHIPYENAVEGVGDLSYVMLVDRPKGNTKVLQSPAAKKDPKKFDDSDFMMEDGGVVSLKDKAVNMNRGSQGIIGLKDKAVNMYRPMV